MNFDQTLKDYQQQRDSLREFQGELQKKISLYSKLGKDIESDKKKYVAKYRKLVDSSNDLVPSLQLEIAGANGFGAKLEEEGVEAEESPAPPPSPTAERVAQDSADTVPGFGVDQKE